MSGTLALLAGIIVQLAGALAYRPLVDPLPMDRFWMWLLLPLSVGVAVVYKTVKLRDLSELPRQVSVASFKIVGIMIAAALVLWLILALV